MKTSPTDRELYLAYRLGELPPAERDALDDRMLADNEFSDRMQEAEYDLLEDYHAGRLTSTVQAQVKRAFPRDELQQPLSLAAAPGGQPALAPSRRSPQFSLAFRFAFAAAATVLIACAGWVLMPRHSRAVSPAPAARTSPPPSGLPQDSGKPPTQTAVSPSHLPGETAVLLLAPAVTRGGSSAQLELRPATRSVKVQWLVPPRLAGARFSLSVQQDGKQIALVPASGVQHIGGSHVEEFTLPRAVFSSAGPQTRYLFLVSKSGEVSAAEAEFPVRVSAGVKH